MRYLHYKSPDCTIEEYRDHTALVAVLIVAALILAMIFLAAAHGAFGRSQAISTYVDESGNVTTVIRRGNAIYTSQRLEVTEDNLGWDESTSDTDCAYILD